MILKGSGSAVHQFAVSVFAPAVDEVGLDAGSGYNYYGALGDGTNTDSAIPVRSGVREESILIYDPAGTGTTDRAEVTTLTNNLAPS